MWLYDGEPDHICLGVKDASPHEGGYVVVFQLDSGETRILATRFPAKCVSSWKSHARRYGGVDVTRVLVSRPHHRYEKIKRMLAAELVNGEDGGLHTGPVTVDAITKKALELFAIQAASVEPHPDAVHLASGW